MELKFKSLLRISPEFDQAEFNQLFLDLYPKVVRVASRMVGDPDEAEDLAVEAFWRLWQRPPSQKDNLSGWLYRVVTNLAYNALRSRKRRSGYEVHYGRSIEEETLITPSQELEKAQQKQAVRAALKKMPLRDAQILILRSSGLSYKEIAASLGIPVTSIGTGLARAEKKFESLYSLGENHALE